MCEEKCGKIYRIAVVVGVAVVIKFSKNRHLLKFIKYG